jgi:hypothetical protein
MKFLSYLVGGIAGLWLWTVPVRAQEPGPRAEQVEAPRASTRLALLRTASLDPSLKELAQALDGALVPELARVESVDVALQPSLDLPAMQLAIDCVGEALACMQAVAEQAGVESLLAPVVRSTDTGVVIALLHYDGPTRTARHAERQIPSGTAAEALSAVLPAMLEELFAAQQAARTREEAAPPPLPEPPAQAPAPTAERGSPRALPIALGAAGVVLVGIGVGLGVSAQRTEDDYAKADVSTRKEINEAITLYERADRKGTAAHISFAAGGAALLAGAAVWLFARRSRSSEPSAVTLVPSIQARSLTLSVAGRFAR